jgi:HD-GYP domain-containing protein (c-di-GMP phosphodiesterase class II)
MRFATRAFLYSFLPFAILLTGTFGILQHLTVSSVRNEVRSSLRETQLSMSRAQARSELQNSRFLRVVGDNAPLKAGLQLMEADSHSADARRTVEDQLRDLCNVLGFDFLMASNSGGTPVAGVMRSGKQLVALDVDRAHPPQRGFYTVGAVTYQVTSIPIDQGDENLGALSVGERFDFAEFNTPAVLTRYDQVVQSNVPDVLAGEIEQALKKCSQQKECELRLHGQIYLSLPMESIYFGDGYLLRSLQNVDAAVGPVQSVLRNGFSIAGLGALLAALILSVVFSRWIAKPLAGVVAHLRESARTGSLPEFPSSNIAILEVRQLTDSFNQAAAAIRQAQATLRLAYLEFVGSLASALDARDTYTAGHSQRVSESACAVAQAMQTAELELEQLRVGALLHDVGKIGISDIVLQKAGPLTPEEFALIQQHTTIGRQILEGVHGFQPYLPIVSLHHENWDGSGYPYGLNGAAVPLSARIVHVVDAYDAMTSDRPYRRGMTSAQALETLRRYAGTQFDPDIVEIFVTLKTSQAGTGGQSLQSLAASVANEAVAESMTPLDQRSLA